MNPFDFVVSAVVVAAIAVGFQAGLLRSLATIMAYLIAAPIAVAVAPAIENLVPDETRLAGDETWLALCLVFIVLGFVISALFRFLIGEYVGTDVGLVDRLAGAGLGAARAGLVAVAVVVIFDRVIPVGADPWFLADSRLRPYLSEAGQMGIESLPPDVEASIDRLKRERGI